MNNDDLCYMSATEALAKFQARSLSPVELISACGVSRATHGDLISRPAAHQEGRRRPWPQVPQP